MRISGNGAMGLSARTALVFRMRGLTKVRSRQFKTPSLCRQRAFVELLRCNTRGSHIGMRSFWNGKACMMTNELRVTKNRDLMAVSSAGRTSHPRCLNLQPKAFTHRG